MDEPALQDQWEKPGCLVTTQLKLRPLEDRDALPMATLLSEWEIVKQTSAIPFPYDERSALTWIARVRRRHHAGSQLAFAITARDGEGLMGAVALTVCDETGGPLGEIGYWLGLPYWGRGFASEAVAAVTQMGFDQLGLNRIEAVLFKENKGSVGVLSRCGYRKDGSEVRRYPDRGGRRRVLLYSIHAEKGAQSP